MDVFIGDDFTSDRSIHHTVGKLSQPYAEITGEGASES
jgi:hypothetical protein